jgi:hypothetical protein
VLRARILAFALLGACTAPSATPPSTNRPAATVARVPERSPIMKGDLAWKPIAKGRLAEVLVEPALYEQRGSSRFFVRVRVVNKSAGDIGVDLRRYFDVLYPNQWGASTEPRRGDVNELRIAPKPLEAAERAALAADLGAGRLTRVPRGGSIDYWRDFNFDGSRATVEPQTAGYPYAIVSMDGLLDVTDGKDAERLATPEEDTGHTVVIDVPVRWRQVPPGALVLRGT